MKTLSINQANDLFLTPQGNISVSIDLQAVMDACKNAAQTQLGEMVLSIDEGVPNFETIWRNTANVAQFELYLRRALEEVEGVVEVTNLTTVVGKNVVAYEATIQTIYGGGSLNG